MRIPINCNGCSSLIGHHHTYPWTDNGQDPPEDVYFDEDELIFGKLGVYCCTQCFLESGDEEE